MNLDDLKSHLRACCADPDDDRPRLILADFLADAGQQEWADLIRHQVGGTGPRPTAWPNRLWCRLLGLESWSGDAKPDGLGDSKFGTVSWRWCRGLPDRFSAPEKWWAESGALVAELCPAVRFKLFPGGRPAAVPVQDLFDGRYSGHDWG